MHVPTMRVVTVLVQRRGDWFVGIAVSNGVLLVDFANRRRLEGLSVRDAIESAAGTRFRPILMTFLATFLDLTPMALGSSLADSELDPIHYERLEPRIRKFELVLAHQQCGYFIVARTACRRFTAQSGRLRNRCDDHTLNDGSGRISYRSVEGRPIRLRMQRG